MEWALLEGGRPCGVLQFMRDIDTLENVQRRENKMVTESKSDEEQLRSVDRFREVKVI